MFRLLCLISRIIQQLGTGLDRSSTRSTGPERYQAFGGRPVIDWRDRSGSLWQGLFPYKTFENQFVKRNAATRLLQSCIWLLHTIKTRFLTVSCVSVCCPLPRCCIYWIYGDCLDKWQMVPQCFSIKAESMQSSSQTGFKPFAVRKHATAKSRESVESCILCTAKKWSHGPWSHGAIEAPSSMESKCTRIGCAVDKDFK